MTDHLLPTILPIILVVLASGFIAYHGLIRQEANPLAFSLMLGSFLGWNIGSFLDAPQLGSALGASIGPMCVLPAKSFKLTGRPAQVISLGWILTAVGWILLILRDTLK